MTWKVSIWVKGGGVGLPDGYEQLLVGLVGLMRYKTR